ncbi:dTDP-4-dehydrorhamnose reductase [Vibrio cholerae]
MNRVLILGKTGQLAKSMQGSSVTQFDCTFLDREECDFCNFENLEDKIIEIRPSIIINCVAYTNVEKAELESEQEKVEAINTRAVSVIAKSAALLGIPVIHISTDYVFAGDCGVRVRGYLETDATNPINKYGISKLNGELALIESCSKYIIIRTSWLFSEHSGNFFSNFVEKAKVPAEFNIVNDQTGNPTYCGDLASAIATIVERYLVDDFVKYGIYHYCGYPTTTWFDFAEYISKAIYNEYNKEIVVNPIQTSKLDLKAKRPINSSLSTKKIEFDYSIVSQNWKNAVNKILKEVW